MARLFFIETPRDEAFDLLFRLAPDDDEAIEAPVNASFDEQSGFGKDGVAWIFFLPLHKSYAHRRFDSRVKNSIQLRQFFAIGENNRAELFAIHGFIRA